MAGIYIHIPYCKSKCIYCDFYSTPQVASMEQYVHSLLCEAKLRSDEISNEAISTIYIGGGTPSFLPLELMTGLINGLHSIFNFEKVEEFTIEVNPDDVSIDYVEKLLTLGVNRVSMGVQSFNDIELHTVNRRHTAQQAIDAVKIIQDCGIGNVSVDLIYGLPGQSLDTWQHNVDQAIALNVQHISAYCLSYEPGTRLWVMREQGKVQEASDELCVAMHTTLVNKLEQAEFEHYEISNFARPGYHSCHNSSYWNFEPYLGLGAAAHSFDGLIRRFNPSSIKKYITTLLSGENAFVEDPMEWWERYDEEVMLRLRTSEGLDTNLIREHYGNKVFNIINKKAEQFIEKGLLKRNEEIIVLTDEGIMLSDSIIRDLMWDN